MTERLKILSSSMENFKTDLRKASQFYGSLSPKSHLLSRLFKKILARRQDGVEGNRKQ